MILHGKFDFLIINNNLIVMVYFINKLQVVVNIARDKILTDMAAESASASAFVEAMIIVVVTIIKILKKSFAIFILIAHVNVIRSYKK